MECSIAAIAPTTPSGAISARSFSAPVVDMRLRMEMRCCSHSFHAARNSSVSNPGGSGGGISSAHVLFFLPPPFPPLGGGGVVFISVSVSVSVGRVFAGASCGTMTASGAPAAPTFGALGRLGRASRFLCSSLSLLFALLPSQRSKRGISSPPPSRKITQPTSTITRMKSGQMSACKAERLLGVMLGKTPLSVSASTHSQNSIRIEATSCGDLFVRSAIVKTSVFLTSPFCHGIQSPAIGSLRGVR